MKKVLVLCTANSCRSVMAEALINQLKDDYEAVSAGSQPAGRVHPKTIETLIRHGIAPGQPQSQSWDDYADRDFDYVITVCDNAANETCPAFMGDFKRLHWGTPDPTQVEGAEADIQAAFDQAFNFLKTCIEQELP